MRKTAVICLSIAAVCASVFVSQAAAAPAPARQGHELDHARTRLGVTSRGKTASPVVVSGVLAYPAADAAKPTVVYLHGIHGRAENGCPWMRAGDGWLVCPEP